MVKRSKSSDEAQTAPPDAAAKLVDYFAAQLAASRTSKAVDAAQEIMFDAFDCEDSSRRVSLARKAIEISPDCADAYVLLAEETAKSPEEAAGLYALGVAAGERALGPAAVSSQDPGPNPGWRTPIPERRVSFSRPGPQLRHRPPPRLFHPW
ncbi:MAG TPA: hypothetical protein VGF71_12255 [Caulobacteraceae bacterium]